MDYNPGDTILNKYIFESLLGQGAFGDVYHVTHITLRVPRAVKILRRDVPGMGHTIYQEAQLRFLLEAQLGARLHRPVPNPHLIQVHDFILSDDLLLLEMEYMAGGSLSQRIKKLLETKTPFPLKEALQIAEQVAAGLAALHAMDVIHRDLKPANILFDEHGLAHLADLGVAQTPGGFTRRTELGEESPPHPGTIEYMSPEQANSRGILKPPSDIYALGLVLFEMLTTRNYTYQRPGSRARALRAELPQELDDLLARMLAETPKERPWNGNEASELLQEILRKIQQEQADTQASLDQKKKADAEMLEQARLIIEEQAQQVAQSKAKADEVEKAQREDEEKAQQIASAKAQADADEKAQRDAEEKALQITLAKAQADALEKARHEAEEKALQITLAIAQADAAKKAQFEAEEKAQQIALAKAQTDAVEKAQREDEEKALHAQATQAKKRADEVEKAQRTAQEQVQQFPKKSFIARYWPVIISVIGVICFGTLAGLIWNYQSGIPDIQATQVLQSASTPSSTPVVLPNLAGKKITVAVENAYPPFNSIDEASGKGVGWDYDAVTEICKRINCVVEFKQAPWDGVFSATQAGVYDMLADGASYTDERAKIVDFSKPYVLIAQVLLVRSDEIRTPEQMKADPAAKIGSQIGTTNEIAAIKYFDGKDIQSFQDFGAAVLALIAKDIDGVVIDIISANGFRMENIGKLKIGGDISAGEPPAFAFPPKSTLTAAVNAALTAMEADGTLAALNKKWGLTR